MVTFAVQVVESVIQLFKMRKLRGFMVCRGPFKELQHIWGDHEFLVTGMWSGEGKAVRSRWQPLRSRVCAPVHRPDRDAPHPRLGRGPQGSERLRRSSKVTQLVPARAKPQCLPPASPNPAPLPLPTCPAPLHWEGPECEWGREPGKVVELWGRGP